MSYPPEFVRPVSLEVYSNDRERVHALVDHTRDEMAGTARR
jgi:hypothetical protein